MKPIEKHRAELKKLLAQSNKSGTFVSVVAVTKQPSKEDAKKLAQLRMNYDRKESFATALDLMSFK